MKDLPMHIPSSRFKILDPESDIIAKYFHAFKEDTWRPSLIAFPHFQTFPSRVHRVMHSSRTTGMLIDIMQSLQGLLSSRSKKTFPAEVSFLYIILCNFKSTLYRKICHSNLTLFSLFWFS